MSKLQGHLPRPIGRPRAFNPEVFKRVLIHLSEGRSYSEAASAVADTDGFSYTRQTVWRAAHFYPPYDSHQYRAIAAEIGF